MAREEVAEEVPRPEAEVGALLQLAEVVPPRAAALPQLAQVVVVLRRDVAMPSSPSPARGSWAFPER